MSAQLDDWFTDPLGIPHVALGGYASQSLADEVLEDIAAEERVGAGSSDAEVEADNAT